MTEFQTGLDRILTEPLSTLSGQRFGLLFNQASLTGDGRYAADALHERYPGQLTALFSPQHGVWGEEQANMIETGHSRYQPYGLPLLSLYSETREPSPQILDLIDVLVIDLQDVGTRVYTFIWTMLNCLQACDRVGKPVVILDRPNPLSGQVASGRLLDANYRSFVGLASIPMQHGLTMAELAQWLVASQNLSVDCQVVAMQGWDRTKTFSATGRHWVCPSPNMPTLRTTQVYPGGVLLEGTNLSEGRGTTIPFEVLGAPFIDEHRLAAELKQRDLPGVRFRPTRFRPTFDKWRGESCRGIFLDVIDAAAFDSYRTTLHMLHVVRKLHPDQFAWLPPPYEYERIKPPIDILTGNDEVRLAIDQQAAPHVLDDLATTESDWFSSVEPYRLY